MAIDLIAQGRFQRTAPVKFLPTFRVTSLGFYALPL